MAQAAGSWSVDACCAVPGNDCDRSTNYCVDRTSSSDWLFGLWPGPPQRFEPTGTNTTYQAVEAGWWPVWGSGSGGRGDLNIDSPQCHQGSTYRGTPNEICGGEHNWGATDIEGWYPI